MWKAILGFFQALPGIVELFRRFVDSISGALKRHQEAKRTEELTEALIKAKHKKDQRDLEKHFNPRRTDPRGAGKPRGK
jgi:hypothetical protein